MRRQVLQTKNSNSEGGHFTWKNTFSKQSIPTRNSKDSDFIREDRLKRLRNALERADFQFFKPVGLKIEIPGLTSHNEDRSVQFHPVSAPDSRVLTQWTPSKRRRRRQVFHSKNSNAVEGSYSWAHKFNMEWEYPMNYNKDSIYSWQEKAQRLKSSLEVNNLFHVSKSTGLRISLPADNLNMRVVDFRLKINDKFRVNDGGHYKPTGGKSGNQWVYTSPELDVQQGDKVYYWMHVRFDEEGLDVFVKGEVEITIGNSLNRGTLTPFRPSPNLPPPSRPGPVDKPQAQASNAFDLLPTQGSGLGGGPIRRFSWENTFEISYDGQFATKDSVKRMEQNMQLLKSSWDGNDKIVFQFIKPVGLKISFPDVNIDLRISDFRVKLNEPFRDTDRDNFSPSGSKRDGLWTYDLPQVKLSQGDKLYYSMLLKIGTEGADVRVTGVLEVKQGDPHDQSGVGSFEQNTKLPPPLPPAPWNNQSPNQVHVNQNVDPWSNNQGSVNQNFGGSWNNNQVITTQTPIRWMTQPVSPPCTTSSQSTQNGGNSVCPGETMFDHRFNTMNGWTHQVSIGGKYPEDEFTCFTKDRENTYVQQGRLVIKPTLLEEKYNESAVREGELNLPDCTADEQRYCQLKALSYSILPPVSSARIHTKNLFTFRYGTVEIRAKLPRGDWIVPELWLEPVFGSPEEKVVMSVNRGNRPGVTGYQLEAGVLKTGETQPYMMDMTSPRPWSQGFHTFKLEWTPDYARFFVDNRQIYDLPTRISPVLSQEVYVSLGVHVGGYRDFPDNKYYNKPWKNSQPKRFVTFWEAKKSWHPTWRPDPSLQIEYVRIRAM